ncbi:MAG: hypothetical protein ACTSPA_13835 [Promethearchaeota archaeon]
MIKTKNIHPNKYEAQFESIYSNFQDTTFSLDISLVLKIKAPPSYKYSLSYNAHIF